jgi:dTDP-4-dehydrorhamnose 3,5-epimerase-like enzyme
MPESIPRILELEEHQSVLGALLPFNFDHLPFAPRHSFFVHGVPAGEVRGRHAHKSCEQLLFCLSGSVLVLTNDGANQERFLLSRPTQGLLIPKMVWGEQKYLDGESSLLVFASEPYSSESYVEYFETFLELKALLWEAGVGAD